MQSIACSACSKSAKELFVVSATAYKAVELTAGVIGVSRTQSIQSHRTKLVRATWFIFERNCIQLSKGL
jgi:hypothetical protein